MDYCGHLMKQCFETQEFILPEPVSQIELTNATPLDFSEEENEVNLRRCQKKQFYDQKICRHLCSKTLVLQSTRTNPISLCESMCFQLTKSSDAAGEVCPFQKYCTKGCPCPYYECEKLESCQKLIPVFDLKKSQTGVLTQNYTARSTSTQFTSTWSTSTTTWSTSTSALPTTPMSYGEISKFDELITRRWKESPNKGKNFAKPFPIMLSDLNGNVRRVNFSYSFSYYECFQ